VSRKEKREAVAGRNLCKEMQAIIRHFFPGLIEMLSHTQDPRNESYTDYRREVLLITRILAVIFRIGSMRQMTEAFNTQRSIEHVREMLSMPPLDELPHWSTINNYLERLPPGELSGILPRLVNRLIRMRTFEGSRIRGRYWQILVDGVHLCTFKERHCPHCLTKTHKDKEGNPSRTEYYHYALEAKLVLNGDIVCSIATEFVENEGMEGTKQDCELKAFYRLAEKLSAVFPRLPVCLTMDSLYACGPVFKVCEQKHWKYIIRFKEGSIPTVAEEFLALKAITPKQRLVKTASEIVKTYRYVTGVAYQTHLLNIVECEQSDMTYPFVFITNFSVSERSCEKLTEDGRRRWRIENEGFNEQKNHGYGLDHLFSRDENAMKNHYLLIQIGHMIAQFIEKAIDLWKAIRAPSYMIANLLLQSFRTDTPTEEDTGSLNRRRQYRFP
jgi:hypothetical protein